VLLDINMPVMNGEEMLRELRADPETAHLPVIVVSTESSETRVQALEELGVAFVHKPFAPEELRATILRITGVPDDQHHAGTAAPGGDCELLSRSRSSSPARRPGARTRGSRRRTR
jgi:two-component system chemotaxis response regulator CheY